MSARRHKGAGCAEEAPNNEQEHAEEANFCSGNKLEKRVRAQKKRRAFEDEDNSRVQSQTTKCAFKNNDQDQDDNFEVGTERDFLHMDDLVCVDRCEIASAEHKKSSSSPEVVLHSHAGRRKQYLPPKIELLNFAEINGRRKILAANKRCCLLLSVLLGALVILILRDFDVTHLQLLDNSTSDQSGNVGLLAGVQCYSSNQQNQSSTAGQNHKNSSHTKQQQQPIRPTTVQTVANNAPKTSATKNPLSSGKSTPPKTKTNSLSSAVAPAATAADRKVTNRLPINALRRTTHSSSSSAAQEAADDEQQQQQQLQISITPRVGQIRVPVDSNTMLKCLISSTAAAPSSSSVGKLGQKFDIHWSRFMYDEHVYEQLDTSPLVRHPQDDSSSSPSNSSSSAQRQARHSSAGQSEDVLMGRVPFNRQEQLRDFLARSRQETNVISDLLIEATLSISPVKASDNASYYCTASDGRSSSLEQNQARIDLIALSRPVVQLERVIPARDSKSAQIHWLVLSDGNTPIKKTILMVKNDTNAAFSSRPLPPGLQETLAAAAATAEYGELSTTTTTQFSSVVIDGDYHHWQRIEIPDDEFFMDTLDSGGGAQLMSPYDHHASSSASADVDVVTSPLMNASGGSTNQQQPSDQVQDYYMSRLRWNLLRSNKRRQRSYNLTNLLPGVTYNIRLAAINDMGQSEWSYLTATMPNEIPAQISEMFLLSRSNDSLAIGWRRPAYDGAKTLRYEMQLFDLNRTLTLDANTNTSTSASQSQRTNFMYIFVNLNPGTDYHFHVRACSRAGCSAYSNPKLLASTLDGEPDEPLEVELSCEQESGNVSVSWLPPANPRGQLLNYSVSFDSRARYRNQSGHWQVDEWRASMETADNQTLSLEAGGILLPNTNYSVRVCANNRSKHCGRFSQLTSRSQCSTLPELPSELPVNFQLKKQTTETGGAEHLQLELPFISSRNGTISCMQIVLIRLPDSFGNSFNLREFLPEHAGDITLSRYHAPSTAQQASGTKQQLQVSTTNRDQADQQRALAYLAEEVDPSAVSFDNNDDNQQIAATITQKISLGDGRHEQCRMRHSEPIARPEVFDGPLRARAFYTGFVKLILVRPTSQSSKRIKYQQNQYPAETIMMMTKRSTSESVQQQQEILTKFSAYFEPVRMGEIVLEPSDETIRLLSNNLDSDVLSMSTPFSSVDGTKLKSLQEMASELSSGLKRNFGKIYNLTSNYVSENLRLQTVGDYIRKSAPLMQIFEVGIIVIVLSLLLLFFVYLITLPTTIARRRKRIIKRRLNKHQQVAASQQQRRQQQQLPDNAGQAVFDSVPVSMQMPDQQLTDHNHGPNIEHQPDVDTGQCLDLTADEQNQLSSNLKVYGDPRECPIHSSPANSNNSGSNRPPTVQQHQHEHRQATVHVCQPMMVYGNRRSSAINGEQQQLQQEQAYYQPQHHHHHHVADDSAIISRQQQQHERNCRTTRRGQQQYQTADLQALSAKNCLTLSHQQQLNSSVLALAKKINKSIPLRLFKSVLECRLRNGWLKEEFEQLPNSLIMSVNDPSQKVQIHDSLLKLRPQLIVSRNDSMSALISGNDQYDAGLISLGGGSGGGGLASGQSRRFICAKSPLDADSVWDFWRLVYEQEVSTIVMLTQNEDANTGELRCAQYWPTCDNEETTILSPCNEFVQKSNILPAKFKIRQETLEEEATQDGFMVRRLTLMVMATKPGENDQQQDNCTTNCSLDEQKKDDNEATTGDDGDDAEEKYVIVQRDILQLQFHCWNTSNLANQLRLITFIRRANERHLQQQQQHSVDADGIISPQRNVNNPMLVHCFNGLGRSGVFAGLSFVLDELAMKLRFERQQQHQYPQEQVQLQKLNLFQLVSKMRLQREMIINPYRFYELLYQLTANCIPTQDVGLC